MAGTNTTRNDLLVYGVVLVAFAIIAWFIRSGGLLKSSSAAGGIEELIAAEERKKKGKAGEGTASKRRLSGAKKPVGADKGEDSAAANATEDEDLAQLARLRSASAGAGTLKKRVKAAPSDVAAQHAADPAPAAEQPKPKETAKVEAKREEPRKERAAEFVQIAPAAAVVEKAAQLPASGTQTKVAEPKVVKAEVPVVAVKEEEPKPVEPAKPLPVLSAAAAASAPAPAPVAVAPVPVKAVAPVAKPSSVEIPAAAVPVKESVQQPNGSAKTSSVPKSGPDAKAVLKSGELLSRLAELPAEEKADLISMLLDSDASWSEVGRQDGSKKVEKLNEENVNLKSQVSAYKTQLDTSRAEIAEVRSAIKELQRREKDIFERTAKLERELQLSREATRMAKKEAEEVNMRALEIQHQAGSVHLIQEEYKSLEANHNQLVMQYQEVNQKELMAQEELQKIQSYLQQFRQQHFDELQSEKKRHMDEIQNFKTSHQMDVNKVLHIKEEEIQQLQAEMDTMRGGLQALQLQIAERDAMTQNIRLNSMDLTAELDRAHRALEEKNFLGEKLHSAESRAAEVEKKLQALQESESSLQGEVSTLKAQLAEAENKIATLKSEAAQKASLSEEGTRTAESRATELEAKLSETEEKYKQETASLLEQLRESGAKLETLTSDSAQKSAQTEQETEQLRGLQSHAAGLEAKVAELQSAENKLKEEIATLNDRIRDSSSKIEALQAQVTEKESIVPAVVDDGSKARIEELEGDNAALKSAVSQTSKELESVLNEARAMRAALDTTAPAVEAAAKAEAEIAQLRVQVAELQGQARTAASGSGEAEEQARKLHTAHEKLAASERRAEEAFAYAAMMAGVALASGEAASRKEAAAASARAEKPSAATTAAANAETAKKDGAHKPATEEPKTDSASASVSQKEKQLVAQLSGYLGILAEQAKAANLEKAQLIQRCAELEAAKLEE